MAEAVKSTCLHLAEFLSVVSVRFRWVRMFLSEQHNGLDILIDYLSTTQFIMRYYKM